MNILDILAWIAANKDPIEASIAIVLGLFGVYGSARGAVATVSEIMQKGTAMSDAYALQLASDYMGRYWPFIPDLVRKWIIQSAFDSMKRAIAKKK